MWRCETFACLGTCGPMHGLFFSCGSVVLSMWRCPWKLYIDVAFSLHNYVEVWPFLCVYGGVDICSTEPHPLHCSRAATPSRRILVSRMPATPYK